MQELIDQVKQNNKEAANELVRLFYKEVFAYVYRLTHDDGITFDLTQEIFIKILKNIKQFDEAKSQFRTYLYRIAHHHTINYLKSKSHYGKSNEVELLDIGSDESNYIEHLILINEEKDIIKKLILQLTEVEQQVIHLRFYENYKLQEIADIQQVNLSTVKSRLYISLEKLKSSLIKEGYYE